MGAVALAIALLSHPTGDIAVHPEAQILQSTPAEQNDQSGPLTVEETLWGIGAATSMAFNQVALQVRNDSAEVFEGTVSLELDRSSSSLMQPRDDVFRELYLGPGESRWVYFGVFLVDGGCEWEAVTTNLDGNIVGRTLLPPVTFRDVVVVELTTSDSRSSLPGYAAKRFPTKSTLLDGVFAVVLRRDPGWQPGQQRAFMEWLSQGGRLIIPRDAQNWSGDLAQLNKPVGRFAVGAGLVVRSPSPIDELNEKAVRAIVRGASQTDAETRSDSEGLNIAQLGQVYRSKYAWSSDHEVFLSLTSIATPRSLALLFYPLVLLYLIAIGLISWITRREKWRFGRYVVLLVVLVITTTVAFALTSPLGGRFAEATVAMSFVIDLGDDAPTNSVVQDEGLAPDDNRSGDNLPRLDVRTFAVHRSPFSSTIEFSSDTNERVASRVLTVGSPTTTSMTTDGPNQSVVTTIPGVTNVLVRSRSIMREEPPRWKVDDFSLQRTLVPTNAFAEKLKPIAALLQSRADVTRLQLKKEKKIGRHQESRPTIPQTTPLHEFLVAPTMDQYGYMAGFGFQLGRAVSEEQHFLAAAGKALPAFQVATGAVSPDDMTVQPGTYRLFVLTKTPDSFRVLNELGPTDDDYTVWCMQLDEPTDNR